MFTRRQKGDRTFVPITPDFHSKQRNQNVRYPIAVIALIVGLIILIALAIWSAMS